MKLDKKSHLDKFKLGYEELKQLPKQDLIQHALRRQNEAATFRDRVHYYKVHALILAGLLAVTITVILVRQ